MKPSLPKGTRDFGPLQVARRRYILGVIESTFKRYGFMPLETPAMENRETLTGKYGDEGDKLLFSVLESGDYIKHIRERTISIINSEKFITQAIKDRLKDFILSYNKDGSNLFYDLEEHLANTFIRSNSNIYALPLNEYDLYLINAFLREKSDELAFNILNDDLIRGIGWRENFSEESFNISFEMFAVNYLNDFLIPSIIKEFLSVRNITPDISEKGLRYDLTVPLARYVVMNRNEVTLPFRRYQAQPVWRADRPQKGRYREFWQCDADIVGSYSLVCELDLLQVYQEAFSQLRIPVNIRLNSRKILAGLMESEPGQFGKVTIIIDKLDKIGAEAVVAELRQLGLNSSLMDTLEMLILFKGSGEDKLARLDEIFAQGSTGAEGLKDIRFLMGHMQSLTGGSAACRITFDLTLARGLSYYTGAIIEVTADSGSLKSSIGGGGRYDDLTGIFGMPGVPGVGISFGLDRIYDVIEELNLFPADLAGTNTKVLFCIFDDKALNYALPKLREVRDAGINAEIYPSPVKMKKQLDYADSLKIPYCVIIGDNEMNSGKMVLKNMQSGEQQNLDIPAIIALLQS